jgi:hypothetical protein
MADYTANAYGVNDSRKDGKDMSSAGLRNPKSKMTKGQVCMRFQVAAGSQIMGGEIFVNEGTTIAASDTFLITVQTG